MCFGRFTDDQVDPAQRLADHLNRHLPGCSVMPADVELLIEQHWSTVSWLAHRVHDRAVMQQAIREKQAC